jgi:hypothetical protein
MVGPSLLSPSGTVSQRRFPVNVVMGFAARPGAMAGLADDAVAAVALGDVLGEGVEIAFGVEHDARTARINGRPKERLTCPSYEAA